MLSEGKHVVTGPMSVHPCGTTIPSYPLHQKIDACEGGSYFRPETRIPCSLLPYDRSFTLRRDDVYRCMFPDRHIVIGLIHLLKHLPNTSIYLDLVFPGYRHGQS